MFPYIREDWVVELDKNLFNYQNPNHARDILIQSQDKLLPQDKKLNIEYLGIEYDNLLDIYKLEKSFELVKSRVPSNADELDIVTYISLFIIKYFECDYEMYEKIINRERVDKIDLFQFTERGKGVCEHFANITEYLLNSFGIECKKLISYGDLENNSSVEGHAFNIVKIDEKQYFLDITWLIQEIELGFVKSLYESTNFLTSNKTFGHEEYSDIINRYQCEDCDRIKIRKSINRVLSWNNNYKIHFQALKDLYRKHKLERKESLEERMASAIPRRF